MGDNIEEVADRRPALCAPEIEKSLVLEVATESSTNAGAGNAERMSFCFVEGQDEGVSKHAPDSARLDVSAVRCWAAPAPQSPVIEQFTDRRMFHLRPCSTAGARIPLMSVF